MKLFYILLFLRLSLWLSAQTSNQNYIMTTVPNNAVSDPTSLTDANSNSTIQYYDGLGQPIETVQKAQSSKDGSIWVDLINLTEHDGFGRENRHWLPAPATTSTGEYLNAIDFAGLANTQYTSSEKPYLTTNF